MPGPTAAKPPLGPAVGGPLADFLAGLVRPSAIALGVASLVVLVATGALLAILVPSRLTHGLDRYLFGVGDDEYVQVTMDVLRLRSRSSGAPLVAIVGASVGMGAILERDLARVLRSEMAPDVEVREFATARQTLWESAAIIEMIPRGTAGALILEVGPSRFTRTADDLDSLYRRPRLGFRSALLDRAARRAGFRPPPLTGIYALDNRLFIAPRLPTALRNVIKDRLGLPLPTYRYRYPNRVAEADLWNEIATRVSDRFVDYQKLMRSNLPVLDSLIALVRARTRMTVVVLEHPMNPRFVRDWLGPSLYRYHRSQLRRFAATRGVAYLELQPALDFAESDFYDWAHLKTAAIARRFTQALADTLPAVTARFAHARKATP
jgi:hypothetical protein